MTKYAYWSSDLLRAELDPLGITTTHAYDANGNETTTVVNCTNTGTEAWYMEIVMEELPSHRE